MGLVDKSTTGLVAPVVQLPVSTMDALDAELAANLALYEADPATYAGLPYDRDKFINEAILAYIP